MGDFPRIELEANLAMAIYEKKVVLSQIQRHFKWNLYDFFV